MAAYGLGLAPRTTSATRCRRAAPERKCSRAYNEQYRALTGGKLTEPQFGDILERDLLPGWRKMESEMGKLAAPNPRAGEMLRIMQEYLRNRREGFEALIALARGQTEQATIFQAKKAEADRLLEQLKGMQ